MDFIYAFKKTRLMLQIPQTELARSIGTTRAWISLCETRRENFPKATKIKLANVLFKHIERGVSAHKKEIEDLLQLKAELQEALANEVL